MIFRSYNLAHLTIPVCGPAADLTDMTQQVGGIFIDRVRQVLEPGAAGCRMGSTRI
jgi:hypothetical protein